jgi:hypothetical protein
MFVASILATSAFVPVTPKPKGVNPDAAVAAAPSIAAWTFSNGRATVGEKVISAAPDDDVGTRNTGSSV